MWSRSVCINESLNLGSIIPFIQKAQLNEMAVIIFNPNERTDLKTGKKIKEFERMESHCKWVYENIILQHSKARNYYFVSHSMGGYCTVDLINNFPSDLLNSKILKIAFTDSVHGSRPKILKSEILKLFQNVKFLL